MSTVPKAQPHRNPPPLDRSPVEEVERRNPPPLKFERGPVSGDGFGPDDRRHPPPLDGKRPVLGTARDGGEGPQAIDVHTSEGRAEVGQWYRDIYAGKRPMNAFGAPPYEAKWLPLPELSRQSPDGTRVLVSVSDTRSVPVLREVATTGTLDPATGKIDPATERVMQQNFLWRSADDARRYGKFL